MLFISTALAADVRIGVLDIKQVASNDSMLNDAAGKIRAEFVSKGGVLKKERKSLQADISKYNKRSARMKPVERKKWERKFALQQKKLLKKQNILKKREHAAQKEAGKKIIAQLKAVVAKIARKKNIDLVISKDAVLYGDPTFNLTDEVMAAVASKKRK